MNPWRSSLQAKWGSLVFRAKSRYWFTKNPEALFLIEEYEALLDYGNSYWRKK